MDAQPETTTPGDEKKPINWSAFILWPFVILLGYFLSYGPIMMMQEKGGISKKNQFIWKIYYPLFIVYLNTPLHKPLGIYLHLWDPKHIDKHGDGLFGNEKPSE